MSENYAVHVLKRELVKAERYNKALVKKNPNDIIHFAIENNQIIHDLKSGIKKLEGK